MMILVEKTNEYQVYRHIGVTRYTGCQCRKSSCTCKEDFVPERYDFYSVRKKFGKYKTTHHNTMDEVRERIKLLMAVPNKQFIYLFLILKPLNYGYPIKKQNS